MASNITFGTTEIGDRGILQSIDQWEGFIVYIVRAEKQSATAKAFIDYVKTVGLALGCDDIRIVNIPRALGVRIYSDKDKEDLIIDGVNHGKVAGVSVKVIDYFANGFGVFEVEFRGSM